MLRSAFIIFLSSIITILSSLATAAVGVFNPYSKAVNGIIRFWAKSILKISGIHVHVKGAEKIDPQQPYIFVSNHQGTFDILAAVVSIRGTARFIAKKELFRVPVFAQGMKAAGMIPIDRGNSAKARKTIDNAIGTMRKGVSVIIFPEGTRSKDGTIKPFKKGGFILALKGNFPLLPMVISGSHHVMKKKSFRLQKGAVKVEFLDPVSTQGWPYNQRTELIEEVRQKMINVYDPTFNEE